MNPKVFITTGHLTWTFYFFTLLSLAACNVKSNEKEGNHAIERKVPFRSPELFLTCTRAMTNISNEIHGISFIANDGTVVSKDSMVALLSKVADYDKGGSDRYDTYLKDCQSMSFLVWKPKSNKDKILRSEKIAGNINVALKEGGKNSITTTD